MAGTRLPRSTGRPTSRGRALLAEAESELEAGRWLLDLPHAREAVEHLRQSAILAVAATRTAEIHFLLNIGVSPAEELRPRWWGVAHDVGACERSADSSWRRLVKAVSRAMATVQLAPASATAWATHGFREFKRQTLDAAALVIRHLERLGRLDPASPDGRELRAAVFAHVGAVRVDSDRTDRTDERRRAQAETDPAWLGALRLASKRHYVSVPLLQCELEIGYGRTTALVERFSGGFDVIHLAAGW